MSKNVTKQVSEGKQPKLTLSNPKISLHSLLRVSQRLENEKDEDEGYGEDENEDETENENDNKTENENKTEDENCNGGTPIYLEYGGATVR